MNTTVNSAIAVKVSSQGDNTTIPWAFIKLNDGLRNYVHTVRQHTEDVMKMTSFNEISFLGNYVTYWAEWVDEPDEDIDGVVECAERYDFRPTVIRVDTFMIVFDQVGVRFKCFLKHGNSEGIS